MNNTTTIAAITPTTTPSPYNASYWTQQVLFLVGGTIAIVVNVPIIVAIFCRKALRKREEIQLIASLAFANVIFGIAHITVGATRVLLGESGVTTRVTAWACMRLPGTTIFQLCSSTLYLLELAISIDRLIAISSYRIYSRLGGVYYTLMAVVPWVYGIANVAAQWLDSYYNTLRIPIYPPLCIGSFADSTAFNAYGNHFASVVAIASASIYLASILVMRATSDESTGSSIDQVRRKRQRRVTRSLAIYAVFAFFFDGVPIICATVFSFYLSAPPAYTQVQPYLYTLIVVNASITGLIILTKHDDIRESFVALVRIGNGLPWFRGRATWVTVQVGHLGGTESRPTPRGSAVRLSASAPLNEESMIELVQNAVPSIR